MKNKTILFAICLMLGVTAASLACFNTVQAAHIFDDTVIVPSLKVGLEGVGGVTFFNGTIVNETSNDAGEGNPVTFGDDVRIDGRVHRGATAGTADSQPFIVNDNMEVLGSLIVGTTNILDAINGMTSGTTYDYDADDNSKVDADKIDSGLSAALISAGNVSNTEFDFLDGVTSAIQTQLDTKGVGDMLKSVYDVAGNSKVDADKIDSGLAATLIGSGTISNTEFGYLNGVTSAIQTQLGAKGVGDMLKSVYDVAGNNKIDASKIDSGIDAALIGSGNISNTELDYLNDVSSAIQTQLNAKGAGDMLKSIYDAGDNSAIDADKLDSGIAATLIGGGAVDNTEFGYLDSINFDNTSNLHLTALGYQAGNSLESTGADNTLVGYQAGDAITIGIDNTAIGYNALGATTTTANNTAVGSEALAANLGTNNTAIGYNALLSNTTGDSNTALGSKTLDANTEGEFNTALGYNALGTNIAASSNTAIGYNAMASNNGSGNMNVAIGRNALDASTGGTWNVAVGYGTLGNGTGVDANTAVGHLALSAATGDNNIGVGYQAGNSISSGASNIVIGYDADVPTATSSNQLNIGGTIWGDLSNDYIAIGGSAIPTDAFLEINQNAAGGVAHIELNPIATPPLTDVDEGDIYMDTDGILYVRSNAAWAAANTAADFSELIVPLDFEGETGNGVRFYSGEINAGDLIVINNDGNYERSTQSYDSTIVGIESGDRGRFRLKEGTLERTEGQRQVGLVGHILVNVTSENGSINPGDFLTTSSLPGHAMKATEPGVTVGKALESFDGSQGTTGMIEVIVDPGWYGG